MIYKLAQTAFAVAFGFSILGCGDGSEGNYEQPPSFSNSYLSDGSSSDGEPDDSSSSSEPDGSCDIEDYKTVSINGETWMAENLNCYVPGSKCYENEPANCQKYGRLYDWVTAMSVCPSGWHIPSNADWDRLVRYVDNSTGTDSPTAGRYLKATDGWHNCGSGASYSYKCEDTDDFSALPGGSGYSDDAFYYAGYYGHWWTASEYNAYGAYYRVMSYASDDANWKVSNKSYLFSVRCVQD